MGKITREELLNMDLHEIKSLSSWIHILKVQGGWIYQFNCPPDEGTDYGVFVPDVINVETKAT